MGTHTKVDIGALRETVRAWLQDNPREMLTFQDAAAKFGCTDAAIANVVDNLAARGELTVRRVIGSPKAFETLS